MVSAVLNIERTIALQRKYIDNLYDNKQYEECINQCEFLLRILPADKNAEIQVKRMCYTKVTCCLKKMGKLEEALEMTKLAAKYCGNKKDEYYQVIYSRVLINKKLGNREKTLSGLNKCLAWFRKNNMYYEVAMCLDVKADLLKNEKLFFEALYYYGKTKEEYPFRDELMIAKFEKEYDNCYERLIDLYIYNGEQNMIKAYAALNNIKDPKIYESNKNNIKKLFRKEG